VQQIPHFVAAPLRLSLQALAEFGKLLVAGNLVADDGHIAGRFNSQANFPPADAEDLHCNPQMGEQYLFVFFAR
jgi:hypothetical protein